VPIPERSALSELSINHVALDPDGLIREGPQMQLKMKHPCRRGESLVRDVIRLYYPSRGGTQAFRDLAAEAEFDTR